MSYIESNLKFHTVLKKKKASLIWMGTHSEPLTTFPLSGISGSIKRKWSKCTKSQISMISASPRPWLLCSLSVVQQSLSSPQTYRGRTHPRIAYAMEMYLLYFTERSRRNHSPSKTKVSMSSFIHLHLNQKF